MTGAATVPAILLSGARGPWVWIGVAIGAVALIPAGLRWLRVAQREHYLADATSRFALRWWRSSPANIALALGAVVGLALTSRWPVFVVAPAVAAVVGPFGLPVRGRTAPLVFTRRLRVLALVTAVLEGLVILAGVALGAPAVLTAAGVIVLPAIVDIACSLTAPFERRLAATFVNAATERLRRVGPTVVAITGSYGKTSTKNHLAHLLGGTRSVVATPASFNNRAGLARAINENLSDGTEIFVAEMGTYGAGEIAELCRWCPPDIAVITAIGPVHLERFGVEDKILEAKKEITKDAPVVVLNVDDPRLASLADRLADGADTTVVRCSAIDEAADAYVGSDTDGLVLALGGVRIGRGVSPVGSVQPTNLACALAVASRLGVGAETLVARVADLPGVPSRLASATAPSGVVVIDDTFNANPAGSRAALVALAEAPVDGRRVLVTPGMVELGPRQAEENKKFARAAVAVATDVVVVGRTNRRALLAGAGDHEVIEVGTREEAVDWVRTHLGQGDAVLYENDLPDHYP
jgi:UDP-N-acetylmuramoyl-tripeptide--D-alanyl-D-alanine ligase